jgi:cytidyltransferase-like protein
MLIEKKIFKKIKDLKKKGKIIGLVHGVFDVIHFGHIKYFLEAKKKVDILIASVTDDKFVNKGPGKPIFNINQRIEVLQNISSIDFVIKSKDRTSVNIINKLRPNLYFNGKVYKENFDITKNDNFYYSNATGFCFPILKSIPILKSNVAILASCLSN